MHVLIFTLMVAYVKIVSMKKCCKCGTTDETLFTPAQFSMCRTCIAIYHKEYTRTHKEQTTKSHRQWATKNREAWNAYQNEYRRQHKKHFQDLRRKYHQQHSQEERARLAALLIITTPSPCSVPGCESTGERHHPDYSKPLEIVWLCRKHHRMIHRKYDAVPLDELLAVPVS